MDVCVDNYLPSVHKINFRIYKIIDLVYSEHINCLVMHKKIIENGNLNNYIFSGMRIGFD